MAAAEKVVDPDPIAEDPVAAAKAAGLRYVSDDAPGIRRKRSGKGWIYLDTSATAIREEKELARIRKLAIPPAWTDVWICPNPLGHIQATGRDARGRKQYRYHERFREIRDEAKYRRMLEFAQALPAIRARTEEDLAKQGLPKDKVLAAVVRLLEMTLIRVGNEEYAKQNNSFGLTTMRNRHVDVEGGRVVFRFRGKSGVQHEVKVVDRRLARVVSRCQDLPGQSLFEYVGPDGETHPVTSDDVNAYLREITGEEFTAKDFRTWAGTVLAAQTLQALDIAESDAQTKKNLLAAIDAVAKRLGNTRSVCRKCYIHPAILDAYIDGSMARTLKARARKELEQGDLDPDEANVLRLLEQRLSTEAKVAKVA